MFALRRSPFINEIIHEPRINELISNNFALIRIQVRTSSVSIQLLRERGTVEKNATIRLFQILR
jgi:hypothetical protein